MFHPSSRLTYYQPEESKATLTAQHASTQHKVVVQTLFVEPFDAIIGAQYMVLGEIENSEGKDSEDRPVFTEGLHSLFH